MYVKSLKSYPEIHYKRYTHTHHLTAISPG